MFVNNHLRHGLPLLCLVLGSSLALAQAPKTPMSPVIGEDPTPPAEAKAPEKPAEGPKPSGMHTFARAGFQPGQLSRYALPGDQPKYGSYGQGYIGGGKPFGGDGPLLTDGVWGFDYQFGGRLRDRYFLGFSHGRHEGPEGTYVNTYPFHVPNVFEFKIIKPAEGGHEKEGGEGGHGGEKKKHGKE